MTPPKKEEQREYLNYKQESNIYIYTCSYIIYTVYCNNIRYIHYDLQMLEVLLVPAAAHLASHQASHGFRL